MKLIGSIALTLFCLAAPAAMAASVSGLAIADPGLKPAKSLAVSSPKLRADGPIPDDYSAYGKSISPPLHWGKGPYGTRNFVLILEDPDAPMATPFVHWMVWNIPASSEGTAEGAAPAGAVQGKLAFVGRSGYFGPRPPDGPAHHYHFQVFALDSALELKPDADRAALAAAMKGHVLASGELVATYQKK